MTVIFSGIQPTGRKHLGNYLGAIEQYVAGQDRGDPAIYCVVDLHAITETHDPVELRERVYDTTAILLAAGLEPERCILFRQSDVREHTELTWLLSSVTELGRLDRMHQFRDKATQRELASAALLFYPVLMAADVLVYRGQEVPVGEDQREHVELMRDVAKRFNGRFGEVFPVPEVRIPKTAARMADLQDPTRKMSTSAPSDAGTIHVLDEPATITKKFKRAVTDSGTEIVYDRAEKPGVTNLLDIYAAVTAHLARRGGRGLRRRPRLRGPQGRGRRGRRGAPRARAGALRRRCGATRRRWTRRWRSAPRRPARSRRRPSRTCARDGLRPVPRVASRPCPSSATSSWTWTSSPGRSTCCSRSCCARSWTCWRSTSPTS